VTHNFKPLPSIIFNNFVRFISHYFRLDRAVNQFVKVLEQQSSEIFGNRKVCIIIPTYNNAGTLAKVIEDVMKYTYQIIVVNDGSSDSTNDILKNLPQVDSISYSKNKGKGFALKKGFALAKEKGFEYAITIDSDGQHSAEDLVAFAKKLEEEPEAIIIGSRNMEKEGVPGKSSFGMKFSNFWFWVETGIRHPDTQSGFRLYPLKFIKPEKFLTRKFEFEIEIIVRLAWKGVNVISVPVEVHYQKREERISHFRPFIDFTRISILNTFLVLWAFLWIKPRNISRNILSKSLKQHYLEQIANPKYSNANLALSIGFGVFMGIVPIWGYQLVTAIFLAYLLKLNKVLVVISANISIPPLIPAILFLSIKTGEIITQTNLNLDYSDISFDLIKSVLYIYLLGSVVLAFMSFILSGLGAYIVLAMTRKVGDDNILQNK
jgi:glycosyltransferase involved in cell wall biosynthesis